MPRRLGIYGRKRGIRGETSKICALPRANFAQVGKHQLADSIGPVGCRSCAPLKARIPHALAEYLRQGIMLFGHQRLRSSTAVKVERTHAGFAPREASICITKRGTNSLLLRSNPSLRPKCNPFEHFCPKQVVYLSEAY